MPEYKGNTNKTHKVKLESSIQQIFWAKRAAFAGSETSIGVFTHHVGNNSDINIKVTDSSGKTIFKNKKKISGNYASFQVSIPKDAKDQLIAAVDLPKHGLNKKSKPIMVFPPVEIKNAIWDRDTVKRGDVVKLSAEVKNVYDGMEARIDIYENDPDGAHELIANFPSTVKKGKIEGKWEFQFQGNVKNIPRKEDSEKGYISPAYFFTVSLFDVLIKSGTMEFKDFLRIELKDGDGNPVPNERYKINLPDGTFKEGKLNENAVAIEDSIPAGEYVIVFPDKI